MLKKAAAAAKLGADAAQREAAAELRLEAVQAQGKCKGSFWRLLGLSLARVQGGLGGLEGLGQ